MGLSFLEALQWSPNPCRFCTPENQFRVLHAHGSGKTADGDICPNCNGTGYGRQIDALLATADEVFLGGPKGWGKGQASYLCPRSGKLKGMVCTPHGFRSIMDLKVGSLVSNPDGSTQYVIKIHELGEQDLYDVRFSDGASTVTTLDHLWNVHVVGWTTKADQRYHPFEERDSIGHWKVVTTGQLIHLLDKAESSERVVKPNVHIPLTEPIRFTPPPSGVKPWELMPPYLWGLLLGDGWSHGSAVIWSKPDAEIIEKVKRITGKEVSSSCGSNRILQSSDYYSAWERFGLANKKSPEKFIPEPFLTAPLEQRWELVQGLMDSDGYASETGHCSFSTTSPEMAGQFQNLARSLGFTASDCVKSAGYRNDEGVRIECNDSHEIYLQGKYREELFTLTRKKDRVRLYNGGRTTPARRVVSVEKCGRALSRCISVSNPNSLYVTDDFAVTHNSGVSKAWLLSGNASKPDGELRRVKIRRKGGEEQTIVTGGVDYSYVFQPDYLAIVTRRTEDDLDPWVKDFRPFAEAMGGRFVGRPDFQFKFPDQDGNIDQGGVIAFSHFRDTSSYEKYQGSPQLQRWQPEELAQLAEEADFEQMLTNMRTTNDEMRVQMMATANPEGAGIVWVANRYVFLKDGKGAEIQPGTVVESSRHNELTGKIDKRTRVYLTATLLDNPRVEPSYMAAINSISDPRKRSALLVGDWSYAVGNFFPEFRDKHLEGEPENALHVYPAGSQDIRPWWRCAIGLDWGYAHNAAANFGFQDPDSNRILIDQELVVRQTGARALGVLIAKRALPILEKAPYDNIPLFLSHEAFGKRNEEGGVTRIAKMIQIGIGSILGPDAANSPDLELHEMADAAQMEYWDFIQANRELEAVVRQRSRYGITIFRAHTDHQTGWQVMHEMLRWDDDIVKDVPEFDWAAWQRLGREISGFAADNYLKQFEKPKTVRPELLMSSACPNLIRGFKGARTHSKYPERIDDKHYEGRDSLDSSRYLVTGIAYDKGTGQLPKQEVHARRVDRWRQDNPDGSLGDLHRAAEVWEHFDRITGSSSGAIYGRLGSAARRRRPVPRGRVVERLPQ